MPEPVHVWNTYPEFGVSLIVTLEPELYQPDDGDTVPALDGLAEVVR